jgi:hypothetical protein
MPRLAAVLLQRGQDAGFGASMAAIGSCLAKEISGRGMRSSGTIIDRRAAHQWALCEFRNRGGLGRSARQGRVPEFCQRGSGEVLCRIH